MEVLGQASGREGGNATLNMLSMFCLQQHLCLQRPSPREAEQMPEACHVRLKPQAHLFLKLSLQPGPMLGARDRGDPLGG